MSVDNLIAIDAEPPAKQVNYRRKLKCWGLHRKKEDAQQHAKLLTKMTGDRCEVTQAYNGLYRVIRFDPTDKQVS